VRTADCAAQVSGCDSADTLLLSKFQAAMAAS
jgi:hypothetical protein